MKPIKDILDTVKDEKQRAALARIHQNLEKRKQPLKDVPETSTNVIQLPLWPEPARGVPNSALRGALFAAIQGKQRRYMKRELLAVQQGVEIRFTGMQLDQSDLNVWEQALHLARHHPLGNRCDFTAHAFLKALGRATGKANHEWLKDVFARLSACSVEITHNNMTYFGPLIEEGARDEVTGRYILSINPKIRALYDSGWTATDWQQRQSLRGKPLALWLHGFLATHAEPLPLKIEYLQRMSGSRNPQAASFRRQLVKALNELVAVGAVQAFKVKDGLVTVERTPSASQQRHLNKQKSQP